MMKYRLSPWYFSETMATPTNLSHASPARHRPRGSPRATPGEEHAEVCRRHRDEQHQELAVQVHVAPNPARCAAQL